MGQGHFRGQLQHHVDRPHPLTSRFMPAEVATLGGRYVLKEAISRGGMATVWRAHDDVLARTVAVKVLHPHLGEDEAFLERFRREALAAARLTHPNVVGIFDTGSEPDGSGSEQHYIVMEYCGGGTLADVLAAEGSLAPGRVAAIGATICDALGYAHRIGVIHRDVKPANVLVGPDGNLKVGDFGIAKAAFTSHDVTTTGSILGTVTYLSPEQAKGEEPTAASDLYSLGVVMYELVVGRPPFQGETQIATAMKHIHEEPQPLRSLRADIPRSFEAVVMKALAKDPGRRYPDAAEMRRALEGVGGGDSSSTQVFAPTRRPPSTSAPSRGQGGDLKWIAQVLVGVLVLVAAVIAFSSLTNEDDGDADPRNGSNGSPGESASVLQIESVDDFDPHGSGQEEHGDDVGLARDGNESTAWTTETYNDQLSLIKPGVGLLFDLGDDQEVGAVQVIGSAGMSLEIRAASEPPASEADGDVVATEDGIPATASLELDEATAARYWIVWITDLPGGSGGSASISEVRFLAP